MQQESPRRSNRDRSEATRAALMAAARRLFVAKGYAETGTPEIVTAAKVTRGALYHHFADKAALFRAVVEAEAKAVAAEIEGGAADADDALAALMAGAEAYFAALAKPGRARLLLREGPAVLGLAEMAEIDRRTGGDSLQLGLAAALPSARKRHLPLEALTDLLSAAFDRAALAIAEGQAPEPRKAALKALLEGLVGPAKPPRRPRKAAGPDA